MKRLAVFLGLFMILLFNGACQKQTVKQSGPTPEELQLQQELETISSYFDTAENYPEGSDTLGAEYYYLSALEKLDSLSAIHGEDSSMVELRKKITLSFDNYLDQSLMPSDDSLSAALVLQDLPQRSPPI